MENSVVKLGGLWPGWVQKNLSLRSVELVSGLSLQLGRIHEVSGEAADSFASAIIRQLSGPVIWIGRARDVYSVCPLAAAAFFDPGRVVTTECLTRQEILWATEQALRSKGASCVISQVAQGPNLKESRRLQLAAEEGRALGLIMIEKGAQSSASQTRWACHPVMSEARGANDNPRGKQWIWEQTKNKNGKLESWRVNWQMNGKEGRYAARHVDMVSAATS